MASIDDLKRRIDLHDLADRLGLKRAPGDKGMYHAPNRPDTDPSLSIFTDHPLYGSGWKDHGADIGGSCIDLVMYALGLSVADAIEWLHSTYAIPRDPAPHTETREKSQIEWIADKALASPAGCREYLVGRGISEAAISTAVRAKTLGYSTYTSPKLASGERGHGGPAVAFVVRTTNPGHVVAIDHRYIDPALNGGMKTKTLGEKTGHFWTADLVKFRSARRVFLVESSINALSIDTCELPGTAACAILGTSNAETLDLQPFKGKFVVLCMDVDEPFPDEHPKAGECAGLSAAWRLYERLTAMNIGAVLVDQGDWKRDLADDGSDGDADDTINDVNDYLQERGPRALARALEQYEPWLIAGMAGDASRRGRPRIFLPAHDFVAYWRYRAKPDFTGYVEKIEESPDGDPKKPVTVDLCGFRVASLTRVSIASATSTMTGDADHAPNVQFAVSVQVPRHGPVLQRRVLLDEQLHNLDHWGKFGPVWRPAAFKRMVTILERSADLGARRAVNFVGLAWRDGRLTVNEGPDCYFTEPEKQCPYDKLTFPSGTRANAARVLRAYLKTFTHSAAALALVWALGGHLKALLGFWPHLVMQADKSAGKSTLIKRIERTVAMTMFSGQSLQTEFRLLTSISHTSQPVGWEELSARRQEIIDKAVALLQESYQYTVTRRGAEMTEYLLCAPVLLAGEDVPVKGLLGKLVRTDLTGRKGPMLPDDLPAFPVRQWLEYLTKLRREDAFDGYRRVRDRLLQLSRAKADDDGAQRMTNNYSAVLFAWRLLCDFAGIAESEGDFERDIVVAMNTHVSESSADREPWVWIMENILAEIDAKHYDYPHFFDTIEGEECLLLRTSQVMAHLSTTSGLREVWNGLTVKSDRVFKRQLKHAGVIIGDEVERRAHGNRYPNLAPISLRKLEEYGLYVAKKAREVFEV